MTQLLLPLDQQPHRARAVRRIKDSLSLFARDIKGHTGLFIVRHTVMPRHSRVQNRISGRVLNYKTENILYWWRRRVDDEKIAEAEGGSYKPLEVRNVIPVV